MDKYEKLKELKKLLDSNLITQDEFTKFKNETLFSAKESNSKEFDYDSNLSNSLDSKTSQIEFEKTNINIPSNNELENVKKKNNNNFLLFAVIVGIVIFFYNINSSDNNSLNTNNSIQDSNTTTTEELVENESTICTVCGRNFTGDGYDKIDGVWQRNTNIQTELCSSNCGMIEDQRQNQKYNDILVKHGHEPIDFDDQSSTSNHAQPNSNGFFTGSDGQLHQVSPCGYCHHTGYIDSGDGMQVCPMCDGKGEKIY